MFSIAFTSKPNSLGSNHGKLGLGFCSKSQILNRAQLLSFLASEIMKLSEGGKNIMKKDNNLTWALLLSSLWRIFLTNPFHRKFYSFSLKPLPQNRMCKPPYSSFNQNFWRNYKDVEFLKERFIKKIHQTDDNNCAQVKLLIFFIIIFTAVQRRELGPTNWQI